MAGRFGCFLLIVTIALLWGGGQTLYTALSNRQPTKMSMAEYAKTKPKAEWLELSDCNLAITEGMHSEKYGTVQEIYIPLYAPTDKGTDKIVALLATKEQTLMNLYQATSTLKTDDAYRQWLATHKDQLFKKTVRGLVRFGIDLKDNDRSKLASLEKSLAPDFIIIDDGKEPSMMMGLGMTGGGLVILVIGLLKWLGSRRAGPPVQG